MRSVCVLLGGLLLPAPGWSQAAPRDSLPRPRSVTVVAGIGNSMGWLGLQAEKYLAQSRVSVFAGLGYTPEVDEGDAHGVAVAGGVRAFTPGIKHRGFLELAVSQLAIQKFCFDDCRRFYGPGLQVGYQFVSRGGFTLVGSVGVGFILDPPPGAHTAELTSGIGLGYTWRKQ